MSLGITIKSIWQQFNNPNLVALEQIFITQPNTSYNFFRDDTIKKQHFDADVSFSYKINSFLQAGVSVMNVAGTKLYADPFVPDAPINPMLTSGLMEWGCVIKETGLMQG